MTGRPDDVRTRSGADDMLGDVFNWLSMNTLSGSRSLKPHCLALVLPTVKPPLRVYASTLSQLSVPS
jgi:hypothetical protein